MCLWERCLNVYLTRRVESHEAASVTRWSSDGRKWGRIELAHQPPPYPPLSSQLRVISSFLKPSRPSIVLQRPHHAYPSTPMPPQPRPPSPTSTALPPLPRTPNNHPPDPRKPPHLGHCRHNPAQECQPLFLGVAFLYPRPTACLGRRPYLRHRPHDTTAGGYWFEARYSRNMVQSRPFDNRDHYLRSGSCNKWCVREAIRGF